MSRPDWRDAGAYRELQSLDAPGFAWEFLRRNPQFMTELRTLQRHKLARPEADQFALRWGVRPEGLSETTPGQDVRWTIAALPSTVTLAACPPHLADPKFRMRFSALEALAAIADEQVLMLKGALHHLALDTKEAQSLAVVLPLDRFFEIRVKFAVRLWRSLANLPPGPDPAALSSQRRDRLIAALRALDGRQEGASYREIASSLFILGKTSAGDWKTHSMRDRVIRAVKLGSALMLGGYRQMLLHPYRRRIPKALLTGGDLTSK